MIAKLREIFSIHREQLKVRVIYCIGSNILTITIQQVSIQKRLPCFHDVGVFQIMKNTTHAEFTFKLINKNVMRKLRKLR